MCTHGGIEVLGELLEVRQSFTEVYVGMLTVEQNAQYCLRCTCVVDHLTATDYTLLANLVQLIVARHI